jgi:hypothetical protein
VSGRAYPTTRELILAQQLGAQATVASICPIDVADNAAGNDPLFGYRPAFATLIDRLKTALTFQCLPQPPKVEPKTGQASCTVLVELPDGSGTCANPTCDPSLGLSVPPADVLASTCGSLHAQYVTASADAGGAAGLVDGSMHSVCQLQQLTPAAEPSAFAGATCDGAQQPGWCYVTGVAAGRCPQGVFFTASAVPPHATTVVSCTN